MAIKDVKILMTLDLDPPFLSYIARKKKASSARTAWTPENVHSSAIMWEKLHLITALHKVMNCTVSIVPYLQ